MEIVQMHQGHLPQIVEIEKLCFSDPWNEAMLAPELTNRLSYWLVAMDGERLAGYVGSQSVLGESDMMNVAVHPDFRRQGIAEALILALAEALKDRGNRCLTLEVRESNEPARRLYEKLGFTQVGLRKNYYRHPRENACILRKEWEI